VPRLGFAGGALLGAATGGTSQRALLGATKHRGRPDQASVLMYRVAKGPAIADLLALELAALAALSSGVGTRC